MANASHENMEHTFMIRVFSVCAFAEISPRRTRYSSLKHYEVLLLYDVVLQNTHCIHYSFTFFLGFLPHAMLLTCS